jgi:hypothetical protein
MDVIRGAMNVKQTHRPAMSCLGVRSAKIVDGVERPQKVLRRLRCLCVIRLVGVLVFAGTAGLQADESRPAANSAGPIRDPMNPQAYMSQLASKLNTTDSRGVLMKGVAVPAAKRAEPTQTKTVPAAPAPVAAAPQTPGAVPDAKSPTVPILVPVISPVATPAAASAGNVVPPMSPAPAPTAAEKRVPFLSDLPKTPEPKKEAASQVASAAVWNGLSPDNQAAKRAMEQMATLNAMKTAAPQNPTQTVAKTSAATAKPAVQTTAAIPAGQPAPLNQTLLSTKPGLTLWNKSTPANLAETVVVDPRMARDPNLADIDPNLLAGLEDEKPWSLGTDLDKYRAHAVKEGSRNSGESLKKALETAGVTIGDGVNVFILGYGSEKAKGLRANDGKGLLDEPGKVPAQAGKTVVSLADGMYSLADLITFDALPDPVKDIYKDNNPLVRPMIFTGRAIGGVWKTTEEIGNAVTWGYFDNVTGCIGLVVEDILELFKHVGQTATNLVRAPVQLLAGKHEGTERAMDWVLLVPLEFVTNSVQMKGIANMEDYERAFEDKGVIGSVLEFGGSTFLVYRAVDEMLDELKDRDRRKRTNSSDPVVDEPTDPVVPTNPAGSDILFIIDGEWPTISNNGGIIIFDGQLPTITVIIE